MKAKEVILEAEEMYSEICEKYGTKGTEADKLKTVIRHLSIHLDSEIGLKNSYRKSIDSLQEQMLNSI